MPLQLTINTGFVTNSSSCIFHADRRVLEHPQVKAFLEAYGIENGYIGDQLTSRSSCGSFLPTDELIEEANSQARAEYAGYGYDDLTGAPQFQPGTVGIMYGDEYLTVTSELARLISSASREMGLSMPEQEYH